MAALPMQQQQRRIDEEHTASEEMMFDLDDVDEED